MYSESLASSLQISLAELGKLKPTILGPFWWASRDVRSYTQGQVIFQVYLWCSSIHEVFHSQPDFLLKHMREDPESRIASTHKIHLIGKQDNHRQC